MYKCAPMASERFVQRIIDGFAGDEVDAGFHGIDVKGLTAEERLSAAIFVAQMIFWLRTPIAETIWS